LERNVAPQIIQSALITAFVTSLIITKSAPFALYSAISASYLSITSGSIGTVVRNIGEVGNELGQFVISVLNDSDVAEQRSKIARLSVDSGVKDMEKNTTAEKCLQESLPAERQEKITAVGKKELVADDDVQRILIEAAEAEKEAQEAAGNLRSAKEEKWLLEREVSDMDKVRHEFVKRGEQYKVMVDVANLESGLISLKEHIDSDSNAEAKTAEAQQASPAADIQISKGKKKKRVQEGQTAVKKEEQIAAKKAAEEKYLKEERVAAESRRLKEDKTAEEKHVEEERVAAEARRLKEKQIVAKKAAEEKRLEEERVAAEARRLEEERMAAEEKSLEEERVAAEARRLEEKQLAAKKAAEEKRLEEERVVAESRRLEEERVAAEARRLEEKQIAAKKAAEEKRLQEERVAAEARRLEEERIAAEEKRLEEERVAAEARRLEEKQIAAKKAAEEKRLQEERVAAEARRLEEERIAAEEKRLEEERVAAEARRHEEQPIAAKKAAEENRLEEERVAAKEDRIAAEEKAFQESVKLAQIWDSNEEWADSLKLENDKEQGSTEQVINVLARDKKVQSTLKKKAPQLLFDEKSREELGRLAREAVSLYQEQQAQKKKLTNEKKGVPLVQVHDATIEAKDYESMTVVELKDALRARGLRVTGKKNELIDRLKNS